MANLLKNVLAFTGDKGTGNGFIALVPTNHQAPIWTPSTDEGTAKLATIMATAPAGTKPVWVKGIPSYYEGSIGQEFDCELRASHEDPNVMVLWVAGDYEKNERRKEQFKADQAKNALQAGLEAYDLEMAIAKRQGKSETDVAVQEQASEMARRSQSEYNANAKSNKKSGFSGGSARRRVSLRVRAEEPVQSAGPIVTETPPVAKFDPLTGQPIVA